MSVPLFLAAVIYWLSNWQNEHQKTALKLLAVASISLGAALLGLGVNRILQNYFSFQNWLTDLRWGSWQWQKLMNTFNAIVELCGWHQNNPAFFSVGGFGNIVGVVVLVMYIIATTKIIKSHNHYAHGDVILTLFTLCGLMVFAGIFTVTTIECSTHYLLPVTIFMLPIIGLYLTQNYSLAIVMDKLKFYLKIAIGVLVFALIFIDSIFISCGFYFADRYEWHDSTENVSFVKIRDQLIEDNYKQGYFLGRWGGSVLTEFSNGEIVVWNLYMHANDLTNINLWLQPTIHAETCPEGKIFFILDNKDLSAPLAQKIVTNANLVEYTYYADDNFIVYVYDNVDELRTILDATVVGETAALSV